MNTPFLHGAVLGLLVLASTSTAHAAQFIGSTGSQCITVPEHGGEVPDGTIVRVVQCRGQANQQWTMSNGQVSGYAGKCLDVQGSAAAEGAQVIAVTCNGRPSQLWSLTNGQLVGIGGKCLNVSPGNPFRAALIISTCSAAPDQQWSVP